ncbi:hypothetical protein H8A87_04870 [Xenorhabdus sp. VLS]|uniref:Uncharacterized protein n=2 Tax=Xenorhabdus lircayensis TaxID=2763499 RepID=A0ABS0U2F6_9GAMM|nr:hypothetical protein [Xenorhabdus lircayensis]
MCTQNDFFIDHLMVEVNDPPQSANDVIEQLGLPLAWSLIETDAYTSVGVNLGDLNIEFINFNIRFGTKGKKFNGFSGIAFNTEHSVSESINVLNAMNLHYRIGEEAQAHTTITVEEENIFPTLFFVKYHFDTSGWSKRLKNEFADCSGGKYQIGRLKSLSIAQKISKEIANKFQIDCNEKNRIEFESRTNESIVVDGLIEGLEIAII